MDESDDPHDLAELISETVFSKGKIKSNIVSSIIVTLEGSKCREKI